MCGEGREGEWGRGGDDGRFIDKYDPLAIFLTTFPFCRLDGGWVDLEMGWSFVTISPGRKSEMDRRK